MFLKIRDIYRGESPGTMFHILARSLICPFARLLPYFPSSGKILDIGCGHGILLNLLAGDGPNRARQLVGIDHAPNKIGVAARHAWELVDAFARVQKAGIDEVALALGITHPRTASALRVQAQELVRAKQGMSLPLARRGR